MTPAAIHSSRRRRSVVAEQVGIGNPPVRAAEDEAAPVCRRSPGRGCGGGEAQGMPVRGDGSNAAHSSQIGSMMDDGIAGTGRLLTRQACRPSRMIEHPVFAPSLVISYWRKLYALSPRWILRATAKTGRR